MDRFQSVLVLVSELSVKLQRDDVQAIDLNEASPLLRHRVYYDCHVLTCPDDAVRVRFETRALRDYVDTAPLRRLKEEFLYQRSVARVDCCPIEKRSFLALLRWGLRSACAAGIRSPKMAVGPRSGDLSERRYCPEPTRRSHLTVQNLV